MLSECSASFLGAPDMSEGFHEDVFILAEELDKCVFLFQVQVCSNVGGLGEISINKVHLLGFFCSFEQRVLMKIRFLRADISARSTWFLVSFSSLALRTGSTNTTSPSSHS
jgi:hypothetical protein